jgi:hypothetical protein
LIKLLSFLFDRKLVETQNSHYRPHQTITHKEKFIPNLINMHLQIH